MGFVYFLIHVKGKFFRQFCDHFIGKHREQLVGLGVVGKGEGFVCERCPKLSGHGVGVGGHVKEQVVLEQLLKLDPKEPAFGQHGAFLLDHKAEIRF